MRRRLTVEQWLVVAASGVLLALVLAVAWLMPLAPQDRTAVIVLGLLGALAAAYITYRASRVGLSRQYPLAALLALGLSLSSLYVLHRYLPAIDLLLFVTVAGTGALWGFRAGLISGLAASAGHSLLVLAFDPLTPAGVVSLVVFDILALVIGGLTGLLSTQEHQQRAQIQTAQAENVRLAQELRHINATLEARVAAAADEVRQVQRQKDEMYEMITHDLKSPLGTMISALLILRDTPAPAEPLAQQALSAALQAGDQQLQLIENLLDLQRLRSGALPLHLERLELAPLLNTLVEQFQPRVQRKSILLEKRFAADLPPVRADRQLIARVVSNLLENAHKFTPSRGRITLDAAAEPERLRVIVADTGPGIPDPYRQAVFEKYRRLAAESAGAWDGAGVGLAFCKKALQAHGGDITVGTSPSGGAQFEFTLPLAGP